MNASYTEFDRLVAELEAGTLSADDARRLETLAADPELRRKLVEYFFLVGELYWHESVEVPVGSSPMDDESACSQERFGIPSPLSTGASAGNAVDGRRPRAATVPSLNRKLAYGIAAAVLVTAAVFTYFALNTARLIT
ncbi:MAG: hypothetical protein D6741_07635, partial [Planctomycetota bacterium]